jgi:hypothetical protein
MMSAGATPPRRCCAGPAQRQPPWRTHPTPSSQPPDLSPCPRPPHTLPCPPPPPLGPGDPARSGAAHRGRAARRGAGGAHGGAVCKG